MIKLEEELSVARSKIKELEDLFYKLTDDN
jgi:hypothetical protein